jgi:hypothetical protein
MEELHDRATLVDASSFGQSRRVLATVSRSQIEDVMQAGDGQPELVLELTGSEDDGAHTLELDWDPQDLAELLRNTSGDNISLLFDEDALERALGQADIEAHGLRQTAAVIAVAAVTAAGASAAHAAPSPAILADGATWGGGATVEMVSDAASTGSVPLRSVESAAVISDTASSAPAQAAEAAELISDSASTGPLPVQTTEEAALISDSASTGPVPIQTTEEAVLISDAASTGPVPVQVAEQAALVSDTASSAPGAPAEPETSAASSGVSFEAPDATETAMLAGAALLITAAGFAVRTERRRHRPA